MDSINDNQAIPNFETGVLNILDMNFVQQYATYSGGKINFSTQWPAKLDGIVTVESKSGATDPTKGGFSFKLGPKDAKTQDVYGPEETSTGDDKDFAQTADQLAGAVASTTKPEKEVGDVGREKRKPIR